MPYLTSIEVCKKLNISRATLARLIKAGRLKAVRLERNYRIKKSSLDQFISASEVKPDKMTAGAKEISNEKFDYKKTVAARIEKQKK